MASSLFFLHPGKDKGGKRGRKKESAARGVFVKSEGEEEGKGKKKKGGEEREGGLDGACPGLTSSSEKNRSGKRKKKGRKEKKRR